MTLTIITGTHSFIDLTGKFRRAFIASMNNKIKYTIKGLTFYKTRFERVEITSKGKVIHYPSRLFPMDKNGMWWSVSQPTGSGKTILAAYEMNRVYKHGGRVEGNLSFQYFNHNASAYDIKTKKPVQFNLPQEYWTPSILTIEDLQKVKSCFCVLDDIKGTIANWQAKEADIITLTSNTGRKEGVDLSITTQRVINYIPPNIRAVATGYEIPYITIRDCRVPTPDNKGFPVEMEVFSLIPGDSGDIFVGFGILNKDIPDGRIITPSPELLNSYRTMELATGLKVDKEGKDSTVKYPGREEEERVFNYLSGLHPEIQFHLKNGKGTMDIESDIVFIDVKGVTHTGKESRLNMKNLLDEHKDYCRMRKIPGYVAYWWKDDFKFLNINSKYLRRLNPTITSSLLAASRSHKSIFG